MPELDPTDVDSAVPMAPTDPSSHKFYSFPVRTPDNCGGFEQRALFWAQMQPLGVKFWSEEDLDTNIQTQRLHLKVFFFCTDQGPDQKGAEKIMQEETAAMPGVLLFRQWCMRHNAHLTSKKTLVRLMKGKYWNELAKIINSWMGPRQCCEDLPGLCCQVRHGAGQCSGCYTAPSPPERPVGGCPCH